MDGGGVLVRSSNNTDEVDAEKAWQRVSCMEDACS